MNKIHTIADADANKRVKTFISALSLALALALIFGCRSRQSYEITFGFLDSLSDTIYPGDDKFALLTNGIGGWYFDDAFRSSERYEFGYWKWDKRYIAGWEIVSPTQGRLDRDLEMCIVYPRWVERYYKSGLIERIELPYKRDGIVLTLQFKRREDFIFRVLYAGPKSITDEIKASSIPSPKCIDHSPVRSTADCPVDINNTLTIITADYRLSRLRGGKGGDELQIYEELLFTAKKKVRIAIGLSLSGQARAVGRAILDSLEIWQAENSLAWRRTLDNYIFRCDDKLTEHAFNRALVSLNKLYTENTHRIMMSNGSAEYRTEHFLLTGIPWTPFSNPFHLGLSIPGLSIADGSGARCVQLFETAAGVDGVNFYSSAIRPAPMQITPLRWAEVDPASFGLLARAYERVEKCYPEDITDLAEERMIKAAAWAVAKMLEAPHLLLGYYTAGGSIPLYGSRNTLKTGAAIETQVLFGLARRFLLEHPRREYILSRRVGENPQFHQVLTPNEPLHFPNLPLSALEGTRRWALSNIPPVAFGLDNRQYLIPLTADAAMEAFHNRLSGNWYDRLLIDTTNIKLCFDKRGNFFPPVDSSQRSAAILALGWLKPEYPLLNAQLLAKAFENDLITATGFRSLSPADSAYQGAHEYRPEEGSPGTTFNGDTWIWTCGRLADIYRLANDYERLWRLFDTLSVRMTSNLIGSLPECENGEWQPNQDNITGDYSFASSLAEYIRLLNDDIWGIKPTSGIYLNIAPRLPTHWGRASLRFRRASVWITLERLSAMKWRIVQRGSREPLQLSMDLLSPDGDRITGSSPLHSDEPVELKIIQSDDRRWSILFNQK